MDVETPVTGSSRSDPTARSGRQTSADGLDSRYPAIIAAVIVSLVIFVAAEAVVLRRRRIPAAA